MIKNLLFVQSSLDPSEGGVPRVTHILASHFEKLGISSFFVYFDSDSQVYPEARKLKMDLAAPVALFNKRFSEFALSNEIDLIICQNADHEKFLNVYEEIRNHYGIGTISFYHANPDFFINQYRVNPPLSVDHLSIISRNMIKRLIFPFYNPYAATLTRQYAVSRKMVLLSPSYIPRFQALYNIREEGRLISLFNPLTFPDFPDPGMLHSKEKLVLIVCRLAEVQKRVSLALRIWKGIEQAGISDWQLMIVGAGPDEGMYRSYAARHGLKKVSFMGKQANVLPYYQKASIFMMTSIWEGFPMVILEAMQNGCVPILFNNFSAVYDQVEDGKTGFIIGRNDIRLYQQKLLALMQQDKLRKQMGAAAMESVKRFSIEAVARDWERLVFQDSLDNYIHTA